MIGFKSIHSLVLLYNMIIYIFFMIILENKSQRCEHCKDKWFKVGVPMVHSGIAFLIVHYNFKEFNYKNFMKFLGIVQGVALFTMAILIASGCNRSKCDENFTNLKDMELPELNMLYNGFNSTGIDMGNITNKHYVVGKNDYISSITVPNSTNTKLNFLKSYTEVPANDNVMHDVIFNKFADKFDESTPAKWHSYLKELALRRDSEQRLENQAKLKNDKLQTADAENTRLSNIESPEKNMDAYMNKCIKDVNSKTGKKLILLKKPYLQTIATTSLILHIMTTVSFLFNK